VILWNDCIACTYLVLQPQFFSGLTGETKPKNRPQHSPYDESGDYVVPKARASGRPHNLGWLKYLDEAVDEDGDAVFGQVPSGEIIFDE
jgi:hypothetical protein